MGMVMESIKYFKNEKNLAKNINPFTNVALLN